MSDPIVEAKKLVTEILTIGIQGPSGATGPQGPQGPQGVPGTSGGGETAATVLAKLNASGLKFIDPTLVPSFPSLASFGSDTVSTIPTADTGRTGLSQKYWFHLDGSYQSIFGNKLELITEGAPTGANVTGFDINVSNYNTTGIDSLYGFAVTANAEWRAEYIYGGFFSAAPGSINADGSPFISGVSSYAGFGHHANTGRTVGFEAALIAAASTVPVVADEVIGLNVWGHANNNSTADKAYGIFIESFTRAGTGGWNHVYAVHAAADAYANTPDGWFLHNLSPAPSLLSGELQFAKLAAEPANPPAGRFSIYGLDNGAGKLKVMVKFPSGTSQQLAIES
ncbi:MAG TPA: hypothetical protein PLR83_00360 [Pyrinomonadaceae bacterium]|nr:hypothetical protein [Pyrinomonadaceae bacterium]